MENVINLHKRTIKNVETLCEFTFAMQFAALEVAARVVVCRALGAECKGELRLRGKNGAKSVDDLDWLDCFDFTGGAHYGEALSAPRVLRHSLLLRSCIANSRRWVGCGTCL